MNWLRATTDEKKEIRKEKIYQAAFDLFNERGYIDVSFNQIALKAGFAKSNLYRYYSSKEEIFLHIYTDLLKNWFKNLIAQINKLEVNATPSSFSKAVSKSFNRHKKFLDLMPFLYISLEKNSSSQSLKLFKSFTRDIFEEFSLSLKRIYPNSKKEDALDFLKILNAFAVVFWSSSSYNETLSKVYAQKDFKLLRPNFKKDLLRSLEITIAGVLNKNSTL